MRLLVAALLAATALPTFGAEDLARLPLAGYAAPVMGSAPAKAMQPWEPSPARGPEAGSVRKSSKSCEDSGMELCLGADGRLTVPGARRLLPAIPGLTPERLTLKRSGVALGYSF